MVNSNLKHQFKIKIKNISKGLWKEVEVLNYIFLGFKTMTSYFARILLNVKALIGSQCEKSLYVFFFHFFFFFLIWTLITEYQEINKNTKKRRNAILYEIHFTQVINHQVCWPSVYEGQKGAIKTLYQLILIIENLTLC